MRRLAPMAQRAAPEAPPARQHVERQEPADRAAIRPAGRDRPGAAGAAIRRGLASIQRPSPAGKVPHTSSMRGCMNSVA